SVITLFGGWGCDFFHKHLCSFYLHSQTPSANGGMAGRGLLSAKPVSLISMGQPFGANVCDSPFSDANLEVLSLVMKAVGTRIFHKLRQATSICKRTPRPLSVSWSRRFTTAMSCSMMRRLLSRDRRPSFKGESPMTVNPKSL